MIQAIGFMIGAYIITRMTELLSTPREKGRGLMTTICAMVTLVVSVLMLLVLATSGIDTDAISSNG